VTNNKEEKRPMSYADLILATEEIGWTVGEDNGGQIVIYTGLKLSRDKELVLFEKEEAEDD